MAIAAVAAEEAEAIVEFTPSVAESKPAAIEDMRPLP
jgi:hypothetical protein